MMEEMQPMDDLEIQEKVESLVGKGTRVIDCEKSTTFQTQEVLLVNGFPVPLNGEEGRRIKRALMTGQVPPCELLNEILIRAGILKSPVELETSMNVKTTTRTTELVTLRDKNGQLVDERVKEVEEDNEFKSTSKEVWRREGEEETENGDNLNEDDLEAQGGGGGVTAEDADFLLGKKMTRLNLNPNSSAAHSPFSTCSSNPGQGRQNAESSSRESSEEASTSASSRNQSPSTFGTVGSSPEASTASTPHGIPQKIVPGSLMGSRVIIPSNGVKSSLNGFSSASSSSGCASGSGSASASASGSGSATGTGAFSSPAVSSPSDSAQFVHDHHHQQQLQQQQPNQQQTYSNPNPNTNTNPTPNPNTNAKVGRGGSISTTTNNWEQTLRYEDSSLLSGTLDALVEKLTPSEEKRPDRAFLFAFLLSARLYIRPHELLGRVYAKSFPPPPSNTRPASCNTYYYQNRQEMERQKEARMVAGVVHLLGEWADLFPYDFRDERMMAHVRVITQKCVAVNPPIRREVSHLLTTLLARLTALERYEDFLHRTSVEAALGDPTTAPCILSICPNPTMLAQQLTHCELERLAHIGPEEFVQAFAKDNVQVESQYKDMKKTRNLECYVQWFNRLSHYVATEICKVHRKKHRIRIVEYWIEVARESFNIGNFNSTMAIIAGLNLSPVTRLKKTWSKVSTAQLSILEHQMDPTANFSSYRSTLKAAVWRSVGATDERQRIVIPFFSLLVKDLYFLNEGCASKLANGHINFERFWQFAKQVTEVITWQQVQCSFPKVPTVLSSLHTAPVFSENALCLASFECESAENLQEKERLKFLRREASANNMELTDCLPKSKHFRKNTKKSNGSVSSSTEENNCEKKGKSST